MSDKQVLVPDETHPITITPTAGTVVVTVDGRHVATSTRALTLQESTYPAVQYVPLADVDAAVLEPTDHTTWCPYKGDAGYYSLQVDGQTHENSVWTYEHPHEAVAAVAGHVAFYPNVAQVTVS